MKLNTAIQGRPKRKRLIPLSPARKNITFSAPEKAIALAALDKGPRNSVLELCYYYMQLGQGPAQALRSAMADLPEVAV